MHCNNDCRIVRCTHRLDTCGYEVAITFTDGLDAIIAINNIAGLKLAAIMKFDSVPEVEGICQTIWRNIPGGG
jgi:hypothetical protein